MNIGMVSLGCDKNRVDSERMIFALKDAGYTITEDKKDADLIIVNSCAFIDAAKEETIDTILEMSQLKSGRLKFLILTGCFATRYGKEVDFPEVDLFLPIKEEQNIVLHIDKLVGNQRRFNDKSTEGRVITTPAHYAYLKIADGCNKHCAYCAIPNIRGKYVSRSIDDIIDEARQLVSNGVKEIILVAQDTGYYGKDIYGEGKITQLLEKLCLLDVWKIRLLYLYPEEITDELIALIASEEKIANYYDIPLQHIDSFILRKMNRKSTEEKIRELLCKIRKSSEITAIRSTFITGFPYEHEQEHKKLLSFVANALDYAGFFTFSREDGTMAYDYPESADGKTVLKRLDELRKMQTECTVKRQKKFVGKTLEVIYEGIDYEKQKFVGRTEYNAPEVDTSVYFTSSFPLEIGNIYQVKITAAEFDLYGETIPIENQEDAK